MTGTPQNPNFDPRPAEGGADPATLVGMLRRKEGSWVEWGQACAALQKSGYNSQQIFEETGFEPIQQNQVIVAAQVYASIEKGGGSEAVKSHFGKKGSDILYELRILTQSQRVAAAELILDKNLDADEAKIVARAVKDFSPSMAAAEGFSADAGDAIAYQCWKLARQQADLQERSRLIARGLKFVRSPGARGQLEQLLTDFTVVAQKTAPRLPVYRLEAEEELPCILPVVGRFPLTLGDLKAVPFTEAAEPFRIVQFSGPGAWVPIPGWRVVLASEDPVAILCRSDRLPSPFPGPVEEVLAIVDRAARTWEGDSYFLWEENGQLELRWFETEPQASLLGRLILILRPKRIVDENQMTDVWQIEE